MMEGVEHVEGDKVGGGVQDKGGDIELRDSNYNTYSLVDAARVTAICICAISIYIARESRFGKTSSLSIRKLLQLR